MADDVSEPTYPSLDAVSEEVERVLIEQRKRADGIDTKAGIALAFAGVLVAVTREDPRLLVICGRIVAAVAGVIALTVVFPWPEPEPLRPKVLLRRLESDARLTHDFLFLFKGRYHDAFRILIRRRRLGLRLTLVVLAISVTLLTLGVTLSKTAGGA
jgi:hypothetical protein